MKKLLLINPDIRNAYGKFDLVPPLAFGIISALTPKNWEVHLVDENLGELIDFNYDLVAITTNTVNINHTYSLSSKFREKSIPVVLGGWHSLALPEEALRYADSVVLGNAECVWNDVIKDVENNCLKPIYHCDNSNFNFIEPETGLFKENYFTDAIETSRGCKNNCSFCGLHIPNHFNHFRKPVKMVVDEIKKAKNKHFFFLDNNFYGNDEGYLTELFEEMIKQKIHKKWMTSLSVNFFKNEKLVELAAKSGACVFFIGFESDTPQSLISLRKENAKSKEDIFEVYRSIVKICHKNGILVSTNVMIGLEEDDEDLIKQRIKFFRKLRVDNCKCVLMTPIPGTHLFNTLIENKRILFNNFPDDWSKYVYSNTVFNHPKLNNEKLNELAYNANIVFRNKLFPILKSFIKTGSFTSSMVYYYHCKQLAGYNNKWLDYFFYRFSDKKKFFKK